MKLFLATYADRIFYKSQLILKRSALQHGIGKVYMYNDYWLKRQHSFYTKNKKILDRERGAGFWLWKPFIILESLKKMNEGDILFYMDAGSKIVDDIAPLVKIAEEKDIVIFYCNGHKNNTWTKRDCFYYMQCDNDKFHYGSQIVATYMVFKKTKDVMDLVAEWLAYSSDARIITDDPNTCGLPNLPEFIDHRHDQSVMANLTIKYNIELFRDPSQWGNWLKSPEFRAEGEFTMEGYSPEPYTNSLYPTIFSSHRIRHKLSPIDRASYLVRSITKSIS